MASAGATAAPRLDCCAMAASRFSKRGRLVLLAALATLSLGSILATGFDFDLMMVLPALLVASVLLVWPDPGIEMILRLAAPRRSPRPGSARPHRRRLQPRFARGGRLIAASLGGRGPPPLVPRF